MITFIDNIIQYQNSNNDYFLSYNIDKDNKLRLRARDMIKKNGFFNLIKTYPYVVMEFKNNDLEPVEEVKYDARYTNFFHILYWLQLDGNTHLLGANSDGYNIYFNYYMTDPLKDAFFGGYEKESIPIYSLNTKDLIYDTEKEMYQLDNDKLSSKPIIVSDVKYHPNKDENGNYRNKLYPGYNYYNPNYVPIYNRYQF